MTVIVWDGRTLAVDRQTTSGGTKREADKFYRLGDGGGVAMFVGPADFGTTLVEWYDAGAVKADWPAFQMSEKDWATLVVGRPDGSVVSYYQQPTPIYAGPRKTWGGAGGVHG